MRGKIMNIIEMNLSIYNLKIIEFGFNEYKKMVDGKLEVDLNKNIVEVSFYSDDRLIVKEFSNYIIALSAVGV
jgi:hypothetical protein